MTTNRLEYPYTATSVKTKDLPTLDNFNNFVENNPDVVLSEGYNTDHQLSLLNSRIITRAPKWKGYDDFGYNDTELDHIKPFRIKGVNNSRFFYAAPYLDVEHFRCETIKKKFLEGITVLVFGDKSKCMYWAGQSTPILVGRRDVIENIVDYSSFGDVAISFEGTFPFFEDGMPSDYDIIDRVHKMVSRGQIDCWYDDELVLRYLDFRGYSGLRRFNSEGKDIGSGDWYSFVKDNARWLYYRYMEQDRKTSEQLGTDLVTASFAKRSQQRSQ